jgi:hypothetical protein
LSKRRTHRLQPAENSPAIANALPRVQSNSLAVRGNSSSATQECESEPSGARLHGNGTAMREAKKLRAELLAHVRHPSAVLRAMADVAAELKLRIAVMGEEFRRTGKRAPHASRDYLAWSNSLTRLLKQFGMKGAPAPVPTLAEHRARRAAEAASAAPAAPPATNPPPTRLPAPATSEASHDHIHTNPEKD